MRIRILERYKLYWYVNLRDKFVSMYWNLPTRRAKKKLKSVYHYLVNNDEKQARHFYRQLDKEYDR